MSVRTALTWTILAVALLGAGTTAVLGARAIRSHVVEEAQQRVDHDLAVLRADHERRLDAFAMEFVRTAQEFPDADLLPANALPRFRSALGLSLVNACDVRGVRLGEPETTRTTVPVADDPVLRRALAGEAAWGTVHLDATRIAAEGGDALLAATALPGRAPEDHEGALFWWVAVPRRDATGRVVSLLYGGRTLDRDLDLVDDLRSLVFGATLYAGKPLGTVTLFRGPVRVATNVVDDAGQRALGTAVSSEVERAVLLEGRTWSGRAQVLDTWYLSGYTPLRDPDDRIIGMLYVGLLEAPYQDLMAERMRTYLWMVALVGLAGLLGVVWLVRRITRPLERLSHVAGAFAQNDWEHEIALPRTYREIEDLAGALDEMRHAIVERDGRIQVQHDELAQANEALQRANRNYMEMLGFVTHELKSPLAAIQMMSQILVEQYRDDVPEKAARFLQRIRRNCEELQGMVKDYLDLSRAERGELEAEPDDIDLRADVLEPAIAQVRPLLTSRGMQVSLEAPATLPMRADAELLRIVATNLLTNAAKYGAADGEVRVEAQADEGETRLSVWNAGVGFTPEEHARLFGKFARLKNTLTKDKRGSGLGLYLCAQIAAQHDGHMSAASEPGQWARFTLHLPGLDASV